MNTEENDPKATALAAYLNEPVEDVTEGTYDSDMYDVLGTGEWLVLNDIEADERAEDYIKETLWAFRPEFLVGFIDAHLPTDTLRKLQEELCEDANELVAALVGENIDRLVRDAILSDGRGHFLSMYDGEEIELDGGFLAYRLG